jgi:hypothetical protein
LIGKLCRIQCRNKLNKLDSAIECFSNNKASFYTQTEQWNRRGNKKRAVQEKSGINQIRWMNVYIQGRTYLKLRRMRCWQTWQSCNILSTLSTGLRPQEGPRVLSNCPIFTCFMLSKPALLVQSNTHSQTVPLLNADDTNQQTRTNYGASSIVSTLFRHYSFAFESINRLPTRFNQRLNTWMGSVSSTFVHTAYSTSGWSGRCFFVKNPLASSRNLPKCSQTHILYIIFNLFS